MNNKIPEIPKELEIEGLYNISIEIGEFSSRNWLPIPNARFKQSEYQSQFTVEDTRGIIINPAYTGLRGYPRRISDELWIKANIELLETLGPEQYLVDLLHILRQTIGKDKEIEQGNIVNFLFSKAIEEES